MTRSCGRRRRRSSARHPTCGPTARWPGAGRLARRVERWWERRLLQRRASSLLSARPGRSDFMMKQMLTTFIGLAMLTVAVAACGTVTGAAVGAGAGAAIGAGTGYGAGKGAIIGTGVGAAAGAIYDVTKH